ncbi:MAG TPA: TerC/Alx family metal homeostasis membrane protein [Tepidisphaeraceae bacterium]|nr:TerC/Alx family metal homeostasis membrane protein [Tepidisphaeraceae bacterium]
MLLIWSGFIVFVLLLLLLDFATINRHPHAIPMKEALRWSAVWIAVGVGFSLIIYDGYAHHRFGLGVWPDAVDGRLNGGTAAAGKYLTGYVLEKALSVDNLFVIAVIFRFLVVPPAYQHRLLMWGILGAMFLRGLMIGVGVELIQHYHWVLYVMGGFLLITGGRLLFLPEDPPDPSKDPILRLARKLLPLTPRYDGLKFLTIENGRRVLTPLFLALVLVETGDAIFAVDSVPAVFGVTADPLLVYTSNIMAILGLRALYFALAGLIDRFRYMKVSLAIILLVVGAKMIGRHWIRAAVGDYASFYLLGLIALILGAGILASILWPVEKEETRGHEDAGTRRKAERV